LTLIYIYAKAVKRLIMIKKKPNSKPFPKETAIYSKCGHRCDLCIHYSGGTISEEFRKELCERLTRIYNTDDWSMRCPGCYIKSENDLWAILPYVHNQYGN